MFRFTIRDVLWLMVVVALAVCWWLTSSRLSETTGRLSEAEAKRQELQTKVDLIKDQMAKAKMDEYFLNSYDGRRVNRPAR